MVPVGLCDCKTDLQNDLLYYSVLTRKYYIVVHCHCLLTHFYVCCQFSMQVARYM